MNNIITSNKFHRIIWEIVLQPSEIAAHAAETVRNVKAIYN